MADMPRSKRDLEIDHRLGEVLEFMRLLWAVDHGLGSLSKRMSRAVGVTGPQRLAIRIVGKYPGISARELADILHLHKSSLTGVLDRLVKRGIMTRQRDEADARRFSLELTRRGRDLDSMATGTVEAAIRRALAKLPRHKIDAARDVLEVIAEALGA